MALVFKCDICEREVRHFASLTVFKDDGDFDSEIEFCGRCAAMINDHIITIKNNLKKKKKV